MACQIEIMFPVFEAKESPLRGFFVDGGTNQSYPFISGTAGSLAPGALPHATGTDTVLEAPEADVIDTDVVRPPVKYRYAASRQPVK